MLLSPIDDFLIRSLGPVISVVARLKCLADVRRGSLYEHWGMTHAYGADAANIALAEIHSRLWLELLRTPIQRLKSDLESSEKGLEIGIENVDFAFTSDVVPSDTRGGSIRHMRLVARALSMLLEKEWSRRQAA
jgi:hypothetical protein